MDPKSAFAASNNVPRVRRSVVVFFDILGFNEQIREAHVAGRSNELLAELASLVSTWYEVIVDKYSEQWGGSRTWEVKTFTDNIVVGRPLIDPEEGELELGTAMSDIAMMQLGFAMKGFFARGGIAINDLYMDEHLVFGQGLLEAYQAENEAVVPRVLLAQSAVAYLQRHITYYASTERAPQNAAVLRDEDGRLFLNYLAEVWQDRTEAPIYDWLAMHRDAVAPKLLAFSSNARISSKYIWVARYHNYMCSVLPGAEAYVVDIDDRPLRATRLHEGAA